MGPNSKFWLSMFTEYQHLSLLHISFLHSRLGLSNLHNRLGCDAAKKLVEVCRPLNLLRTAGRFIDQKHKGQGRIISIRIANK